MDTKDVRPGFTVDVLIKLLERVEASITGINSKASILFYLNGFLLTNLVLQWPRFYGSLKGHTATAGLMAVALLAMAVAVLGIMVSLWLSYSAILPGNVSQGKVEGPLSRVFFAHIASRSADAYWREVENCPCGGSWMRRAAAGVCCWIHGAWRPGSAVPRTGCRHPAPYPCSTGPAGASFARRSGKGGGGPAAWCAPRCPRLA